jgi:membrane associated rhomboid family serine protease
MSSASDLPPNNPILAALESWQERTPLVTRYIITIHAISYFLSWFIDGTLALATVPYFVLKQLEIYRILLSPLVNKSLFSVIFAVMTFAGLARRLEYALGSAAFGWMCLFFGLTTNLVFLILASLLSLADPTWMLASASGMWLLYLGLMAVACLQAPLEMRIRLCFFNVPVLYFPLVLHLLLSVMESGQFFGNSLSLLLGYTVGSGYLPAAKLNSAKAKQWEESLLASLAQRSGWVSHHAALGLESGWSDARDGNMVRV